MKFHRALTILILLASLAAAPLILGGCAALDEAHMGEFFVSRDGSIRGSAEVAGRGGNFNRNTGLNLTAGDNSTAALILVAVLGVAMFFVYPIQRSIRIRKEKAAIDRHEKLKGTL